MQTSVAKKLFAVGVAASTVLLGFAPFAASAAAHAEGTNVSKSDGTVGMIIGGQFRPYTSAGAFLSYGFNSWGSVVTANADDLALPTGAFIAPQDGKIFCATETKGTDVKGECSLITGGQKAAFTSASVFTGLGFSFSRAQYGDSSFLAKSSNVDNTTAAHRPGVLVNNNGTVQLVGASGLLGIPDVATFNSWGSSFSDVVPANAADKTMTQTGVMAARIAGQLSPTALANVPGSTVVSGNVSVSLASDSPAAQTLAVSSTVKTVATLAKFTFSGTGTVTQLQVKRIGVSADTDLSNVYLFNGDTRLSDAASVGGSSLVTFNNPNGLFTVNGSVTVSVVAEVPAGTTAGKTVGMQLTSYTVASGTPATVAISGSFMTTAASTDLAYADFNAVTPGDTTLQTRDAAKDTEVFRSSVSVNNRDMTLSRFIVRNIGSAQQADINNFRLRVDGNQVAQVQSMDANGYVNFSFSPVTLKAGARVFSVVADIISGTSRTFQFQVRNASDVNFTDTQYGTVTATNDTYPVGSANSVSISTGTLSIQKASDSPSGNVVDGTSDVTLAKYTVTAYGEPMQIQTLQIGATSSDATVGSLRNGRVLVNGVQYGSTATLSKTTSNTYITGGTTYTLNYTVNPGTPVTLEVHADMYDNDGTNNLGNSDTVTAYIMADAVSNVQRMTSLGYVAYPSSSVAGNSITDVTGSVTLNKNSNYANQTTPVPQTSYKLAAFNLTGNSSEDVSVNTIDLALKASSTLTTLNNVKVLVNGNMFGSIKSTVAVPSTPGAIGATSTYSGSFSLPKNTTATVEVWGDIGTVSGSYSTDYVTPRIAISGNTVNSSASVSAAAEGQQITFGSGSVTFSQDASTPVAALIAGNQTRTVAAFKVQTSNDTYTVSELDFTLSAYTTVSSVVIKAGGDALNSNGDTSLTMAGGASTVNFTGMKWVIPANATKVLTVDLVLSNVGIGAGTHGENVAVTLSQEKVAPSSTGVIANNNNTPAGNAQYVFKAVPTLTNVTLPTGALAGGSTNVISKFQISSGGTGAISWTHLVLSYATSSAGMTLTLPTLWDADANTQITASSSVDLVNKRIVFDTAAEQQVSGAKNYVVKVTTAGSAPSTGDYIATSIASNGASVTAATAADATSTIANSFVWSDQSGQSPSTQHSLTTTDWFTDYLVKNIPTDSQTLTK